MSRSALESAFIDVSEKKMSIRKAAAKWEIKRSTLGDRVSGRTQFGRRSGPPPFLTTEEETQVADWIIGMAERGFGVTKKQLLYTVKKILDTNKKIPCLPGQGTKHTTVGCVEEYGNRKYKDAMMVWVPRIDTIPSMHHDVITDEKKNLSFARLQVKFNVPGSIVLTNV
ncbi:uncharacterized protein LOC144356563 isoform X2 [Saccoglossus kowalevskii]